MTPQLIGLISNMVETYVYSCNDVSEKKCDCSKTDPIKLFKNQDSTSFDHEEFLKKNSLLVNV